jgi:adenosylcobinamide-GDP ribazoletransferase
VGIVVGGLSGGIAQALAPFLPPPFVPIIAFASAIVLTGAIHIDGFLDTCDAAFAALPRERRLEILKDPHHGTFAIAYFGVAVAIWVAALFALPVGVLAQACAVCAGAARFGAIASAVDRRPPPVILAVNAVLLVGLALTLGACSEIIVGAVVIVAFLQSVVLRRTFGKLTGDMYGSIIVCGEIAALVGFALLLRT